MSLNGKVKIFKTFGMGLLFDFFSDLIFDFRILFFDLSTFLSFLSSEIWVSDFWDLPESPALILVIFAIFSFHKK